MAHKNKGRHPVTIAILMATYNGGDWLEEQLDSIFLQQGCNIHIFVNDDGSSDQSLEIIKDYPRFADITITTQKCGGAGANFLHLVRSTDISAFDYVAFSDQDDVWKSDKLMRAVSQLRVHHASAYSSNVTAYWPDGERRLIVKSQPLRLYDYLFESAGPGCTFVLPQKVAHELKEFLDQCPPSDLAKVTLHDWLIYSWVRSNGGTWHIDDFSGLDYRQHGNNVMGASRNRTAMTKRWKMVSDGWYLDEARRNALLVGDRTVPAKFLMHANLKNLFHTLVKVRELRRRKSEALLVGAILLRELFKIRKIPE